MAPLRIGITFTYQVDVPRAFIVDAATDWTHFMFVHHKYFVQYQLLLRQGRREVFLYKTRFLYPLPFYDTYLAAREYEPSGEGYRTVYYHVRSGRVTYHEAKGTVHEGVSAFYGSYVIELAGFWRLWPALFRFLFFRRMRKIQEEDREWLHERARAAGSLGPGCGPEVPPAFDFFGELFARAVPPPDKTYRKDWKASR
jgi:hypothetical protein